MAMTEIPPEFLKKTFPAGHVIADPDDRFEVSLGPFYTPDNGTDHSVMFLAEQRHLNASNVVHGALLMTLADLAICYTARQGYPGERSLTISMNADFVDGGLLGELIVAEAEVIRRTGSFVFMRTQVTAQPAQSIGERRVLLNVGGVVKRIKPR